MHYIILDTNIILNTIKLKIDLFSEIKRICNFPYKLYILDKTLEELKNKKNSKLAIQILNKKNINLIKTDLKQDVDSILLKIKQPRLIIATNDKALIKKLKIKGKGIIYIKQRKYLEMKNVL